MDFCKECNTCYSVHQKYCFECGNNLAEDEIIVRYKMSDLVESAAEQLQKLGVDIARIDEKDVAEAVRKYHGSFYRCTYETQSDIIELTNYVRSELRQFGKI